MEFDQTLIKLEQGIRSWFFKVDSGTNLGEAREEVFEEYAMNDIERKIFTDSLKPTIDYALNKYI